MTQIALPFTTFVCVAVRRTDDFHLEVCAVQCSLRKHTLVVYAGSYRFGKEQICECTVCTAATCH